MKKNVGGTDKLLRIILSMMIMGAGFYIPSWWGLLGVIPLFSAIGAWCPLYAIVGISTCRAGNCDA